MKKGVFITVLLLGTFIYAQKNKVYTFGKVSTQEKDLKIYKKDSTANAVFLFENGETVFKDTPTRILINTKYYAKIKIFNKEGVAYATVEIPIYQNKQVSERVKNIKAVTHNGFQTTYLKKENIFTEKINENWSLVKFTMPNIKEQSIIEYEYTLESPFKFTFKGWPFQADIPKIYSRFHALIPGNYVYNRTLVGPQKLSVNKSGIKKDCFGISGYSQQADCEEVTYVMEDIPAFIEEDYMTSRKNYMSNLKFELSEFIGFDGINQRFTKRWKDVDKEFRTEKSIGRQLRKIDYIEKRIPKDLFAGDNQLAKAQKVYNFIKNHFTWNKEIRLFEDVTVKSAFDKKVGNSTEINIALINALNAVGIKAEIVLLSTRKNGLPTKQHPVITGFNYSIAHVKINEKEYLLDATDKLQPFGMIPYRALNGYGRVMDFKKGSYWIDIKAPKNNQVRVTLNLKINDERNFEGLLHKSYSGYRALSKRKSLKNVSEEKYLDDIESTDDKLTINSYKNTNLNTIEKPFTELFDVTIENEDDLNTTIQKTGENTGSILILNPFITSRITKNPFQLKERSYPVDFGYPRTFQYTLLLKIPEQYKVKSLPDNVAFKLPNGGGVYFFNIEEKNNQINMISRYVINRAYFVPQEYPYLKEFYNQIIKTQNSLITLEKI